MDIDTILANLVAALPALVPIIYTLVIAAGLDLLSGVWAAYTSGTFDSKFLPAWIASHGDKIVRVLFFLLAGVSVGGTDTAQGLGLIALGGTQAGVYLASVIGSIKGNVEEGRAKTKGIPTSVEDPGT